MDILLQDKSAERFARRMGFTQKDGTPNAGYGSMYFMFYTERQLNTIQGLRFFSPSWPRIAEELRLLFERRAAQGLQEWLPNMWKTDVDPW